MVNEGVTLADYIANLRELRPDKVSDLDPDSDWFIPAINRYLRVRPSFGQRLSVSELQQRALADLELLGVVLLRFGAIQAVRSSCFSNALEEERQQLKRYEDNLYGITRRVLDAVFAGAVTHAVPVRPCQRAAAGAADAPRKEEVLFE